MKFSQHERKVIFFCLFLAVIFVAFVFVAKTQMSIILWWQEHFRKDVSFVSTLKEPNSYALWEALEREFTSILCIVGTSLAVFVLGTFFRKKEYASQSIPLKKVFFSSKTDFFSSRCVFFLSSFCLSIDSMDKRKWLPIHLWTVISNSSLLNYSL